MLLLCSDGLTTMVPDEEIERVLGEAGGRRGEGGPRRSWTRPTPAAGEDNITVVLLKFEE